MTEILTESFCERCGTRYTFESARPRVRLKGVKVLSRGLKNFVMSDDSSIDEAMAAARSDTDRELTAHQLDAFHKTFNFCMSCRQYTCPNCWNQAEARCLTCAPHLGHEVLPAPFPDLVTSSYLVADPVDVVPQQNGANGWAGIADEQPPAEATPSNVDITDFATRLQALMSPPELEQPTVGGAEPPAAPPVVVDVAVAAAAAAPAPEAPSVEAPPEVDTEPVVGEAIPYVVGGATPAIAPRTGIESAIPYVISDVAATKPPAIEPVAAGPEPVVQDATATDDDDEAAQIAARLAAFGAAAAVVDAKADDAPATRRSVHEKGAAAASGGLLRRFRANEDLEAQLDAYEKAQTETAEVQPTAAAAGSGEVAAPEAALEPEPAVAAVEPEIAEAVAAEAVVEPEIAVAAVAPPVEPEIEVAAVAPAVEPQIIPEPEAFAGSEVTAELESVPEPAFVPPDSIAEPAAEPEVGAEPEVVAEPELVAEPDVAAATGPETTVAIEPEALLAPEPETGPAAAEPEPQLAAAAPDATTEPPVDVIPQPTWQIVAPDPATEVPSAAPTPPSPSIPAAAQANAAEPQWPTRPEWPGGVPPAAGLPFLNRPPTPTGGLEALWAESAREVVAPLPVPGRAAPTGGVQPCVSCGLSLSATARFCRRCGTPQAS